MPMPFQRSAMITQTVPCGDWQPAGADLITDLAELRRVLDLPDTSSPDALAAADGFAVRVPRSYVARMRKGDPDDPLLRQVLASAEEVDVVPGYSADPLEERDSTPVPGILHKYHGRVLLMVTGACAVHCRYCFRRHFPYAEHVPGGERLARALDWLAGRDDIQEVILSGGDPLSVSDRRLRQLLDALAGIPHVQRLRIHTRQPVVMPERVSDGLLAMLAGWPGGRVMVLHANHARELDDSVRKACQQLAQAGVTLLNQAVLLKGVNDGLEQQLALANTLFDAGVMPYYLHQLDRVQGAAHFQVSDDAARRLHGQLQARLPGYLVPRLVQELPGAASKTALV